MSKIKAVKVVTEDESQFGLIETTSVGWFAAVDAAHVGDTTEVLKEKFGEWAVDSIGTRFEIVGWGETAAAALKDAEV